MENRRRNASAAEVGQTHVENSEFLDLTDGENPEFRYSMVCVRKLLFIYGTNSEVVTRICLARHGRRKCQDIEGHHMPRVQLNKHPRLSLIESILVVCGHNDVFFPDFLFKPYRHLTSDALNQNFPSPRCGEATSWQAFTGGKQQVARWGAVAAPGA